jgi:CDP-diacylglycerol--glycerol-3-phosphate 3-phosphatidyltransferase/CDP-diacylglycerol--serine O-phosphatidyltransferase
MDMLHFSFDRRHLANIITLTRIIGVCLIFWLTPYKTNYVLMWVAIIYTITCVTDFIDGWVARKLNIVTDIGKILDPLADKILVLVFLPLLEMQVITSFPVFIILATEFAKMALRVSAAKNGTIMAAKFSGKVKTAVTLPICGILFARVSVNLHPSLPTLFQLLEQLRIWIFSWPNWFFGILIWSTVIISLWSFFDYFGSFLWQQYIYKAGGDEKKARKFLRMLIPNSISMLNLSFGIAASISAAYGRYNAAVLLVLIGILLDALDGTFARKLDAVSNIGAKLDSKADFISFGIAPAIVILRIILSGNIEITGNLVKILSVAFAFLYYGSVHYRLRRFDKSGHSSYFDGLPSPVAASLVVIAAISPILSQAYIFISIVTITSLLMISRIPYPHNIESKKTFLRYLQVPTFIFFCLTILNLLNIHIAKNIFVYEILFSLTCIYVISPLFLLRRMKSN